jgi:prevent-host-death family protein
MLVAIGVAMVTEIGAYDARTHWLELLKGVKDGKHYVITLRGEPVAELMPMRIVDKQGAKQAAERLLGLPRQGNQPT